MVTGVDVGYRGTVANNVSIKVPGIAQVIVQEHGVRACGRPVDGVVSTHDRLRVRLSNSSTKGRQIGVRQVDRQGDTLCDNSLTTCS